MTLLCHVDALCEVALALVLKPPPTSPSQSSCVYELLSFVSELAEQLAKSALVDAQNSSIDELTAALMDAFAGGGVDFAVQPTFVSSAAVACLHSLLRLLRVRSPTGVPMVKQCEWLRRMLHLVMVGKRSSLTQFALDLLEQQRLEGHLTAAHSSQESFVSATSRFPFLQTWIAFGTSVVLALVENRASLREEDLALVQTVVLGVPGRSSGNASTNTPVCSLPDRVTLLAVLSEQDDVMVDVLHTLLQLTIEAESSREASCSHDDENTREIEALPDLQRYLSEQLDPDLLFADILRTFGHDHLVLLDLLISSGSSCLFCSCYAHRLLLTCMCWPDPTETRMLEYLLRYLRRLGANWEASRAVLSGSSTNNAASDGISSDDCSSIIDHEQNVRHPLDDVMAVLIRLRIEIDKQVAAGMFPYNPKPLLRRLLHTEELYDGV